MRPRGPHLAATALLGALAGCGGQSQPGIDRRAYLAVVQDPAAAERCAEIEDESLRAECTTLAALARAEGGELEAAQALCGTMEPGSWRDECHFLACDGAVQVGRDAVHCCKSAGQFRRRCVGHAMGRDAMRAFDGFPLGEEAAAFAAVEAVIATYQGPQMAHHKAEQIVRTALVQRAGEGPLREAVCGSIEARICAQVYEELLRAASKPAAGAPSRELRAACGATVSADRVAELGLPVWEPALEAVAQDTWSRICAR